MVRLNPAGERLLGTAPRRPSAGRAPTSSAATSLAGTRRRPARWPRSSPTRRSDRLPRDRGRRRRRAAGPGRRRLLAGAPPAPAVDRPRGDGDPPRHQRRPGARGAPRRVRRDGQPRAADAAGPHPGLHGDTAPLRPRAGPAAGVHRTDRRGVTGRLAIARRPDPGHHPPRGRSADPGAPPTTFAALVARLRGDLRSPAAPIASSSRAPADLPPWTSTCARVGQILENLVGNASSTAAGRLAGRRRRPTDGRVARRRRRRRGRRRPRGRNGRSSPSRSTEPGTSANRGSPARARPVHLPAAGRGPRRAAVAGRPARWPTGNTGDLHASPRAAPTGAVGAPAAVAERS